MADSISNEELREQVAEHAQEVEGTTNAVTKPSSPQNEMLSASLFSSKVRNMVSQYKDEICDLERQVREAVAENFKYLDVPEAGRVTRIVEKHIANMNAEILGIQEDMLHYELSKLDFGNTQKFPYRILLQPAGFASWYENISRTHKVSDIGRVIGYNNRVYNKKVESGYTAANGNKYNGAQQPYWSLQNVYIATLIDSRTNRIIWRSVIKQHIGTQELGAVSYNDCPGLRNSLMESGSGSILHHGTFFKERWMADVGGKGNYLPEGIYGAYGYPSAGFYTLRPWRDIDGDNAAEIHAGAYRYGNWGSWAPSGNAPQKCGPYHNASGYTHIIRCNADGTPTNEANSSVKFLRGYPLRGASPVRFGDFVSSEGATGASNNPHWRGWENRYESTAAADLIQVTERSTSPVIASYNNEDKGKFPAGFNIDNYANTMVYYWTWRNELPSERDVQNVTDILKFFFFAATRFRDIVGHNNGTPWGNQEIPSSRVSAYDGFRQMLPKGNRHREKMFKVWKVKDTGDLNPTLMLSNIAYHVNLRSWEWEPRFAGISAQEEIEDRIWRNEALKRGEPLWDFDTEFPDLAQEENLDYYRRWGAFVDDQERFHLAQQFAQREDATDADKKNYDIIKRWFYTKYNHLRNRNGSEKVELLSSQMMTVLGSMDI